MNVKIIATDLDGTLMSTDHQTITERTKNALQAAHDRGVKIAIATGRALALIDNVTAQIPFADYVIYSNGAAVFDRNKQKIVYHNPISNQISLDIIRHFLGEKVFFDVSIGEYTHYQRGMEEYFELSGLPQNFIEEAMATMIAHDDLIAYASDKSVDKITFYSLKESEADKHWKKLESFGLQVTTSFKGNIEATAPTADKGMALKGMCDLLGFKSEEVMSFGDGGNDCLMLQYAGYSFAMENASSACKAAAKYIAKSNAEDGLAREVERIVLKNDK